MLPLRPAVRPASGIALVALLILSLALSAVSTANLKAVVRANIAAITFGRHCVVLCLYCSAYLGALEPTDSADSAISRVSRTPRAPPLRRRRTSGAHHFSVPFAVPLCTLFHAARPLARPDEDAFWFIKEGVRIPTAFRFVPLFAIFTFLGVFVPMLLFLFNNLARLAIHSGSFSP